MGLGKHVCKLSGPISKTRLEKIGFCAKNMRIFSDAWQMLSFSLDQLWVLKIKNDLTMALRSQIFN